MSKPQPCYNNGLGCKDRYPGCSTMCPKFKIWRAELDRMKRKSSVDPAIKSYTISMIEKQKQRAHKLNK